jgi:hypothetical protein
MFSPRLYAEPMPDPVPHRQFKTDDGQRWDVWEIRPDPTSETLREAWLCFENGAGERWRFAPIPHGWEEVSDGVLQVILSVSLPVPARRS